MKKIILKLTLISLIAGMAFLPQQMFAMNINSIQEQKELDKQLLKAAQNGDLEETKRCLDNGANIETKDNDGWTPLIRASYNGHLDIVKYLIEQGANIEAKDNNGWTPLIRAAYKRHIDIVKFLIQNSANIEAKDNDGWTPLICASMYEHLEVVKHLIKHSANPLARSNNNKTAYDYASRYNIPETADYLLDVQNEFENFKKNPTKWTVAAPKIPNAPKSTFIKILYNNHIYYIDTVKYTDLCSIFAKFHNANKNEDLKKFLDACGFSKKILKKLRNIGFPLNGQELTTQENFLKNTKESTSFDIKFLYNQNIIQNNQNN